jgi:hypothetical protein
MHLRNQLVRRFMIAGLLAAPVTFGACSGSRIDGRVYDPYYGDYHRWNRSELGLYGRWEAQTGRPHVDFGRRPAAEQRAYFGWRHGR